MGGPDDEIVQWETRTKLPTAFPAMVMPTIRRNRETGERTSNFLHPTSQQEPGEYTMAATQEKITGNIGKDMPPESDPTKIDRNAPASSDNSLGAESVRDRRPSTDDSVVDATDEESPPLAGN
jgi:hypothetical protein